MTVNGLNGGGKLWRMPATGAGRRRSRRARSRGVNNDHGISPDGKSFAISAGQSTGNLGDKTVRYRGDRDIAHVLIRENHDPTSAGIC